MPRRRSLRRDRGLEARMLATMFLLGLVYVILISVLVAAGLGAVTVAVIACVLFIVQYFSADRLALASLRAQEVTPQQAPDLHAAIERLRMQADLPMPRVAIAQTPMPNAFAVGRSPSSAMVCVTTGLLGTLDQAELECVLAHELTHVLNRDVMLVTIASFFASVAAFIVQVGLFFGGGGRDHDDNGGVSFALVIVVSGLVYVISFVLLQALSRYREFAADRGAAVITGHPGALASALTKITERMDLMPRRDLRAASAELAAFYIVPPRAKQTVAALFSTHPPLQARLAALARLEAG